MTPKTWIQIALTIILGCMLYGACMGILSVVDFIRFQTSPDYTGMPVIVPTLMNTPTSNSAPEAAPLVPMYDSISAPASVAATPTVSQLPNTGGILPPCGVPVPDPYTGELIVITPGAGARYGCWTQTPIP